MRFIIRQNGTRIGELSFDGTIHHFDGSPNFGVLLANLIRNGVSVMRDVVFDDKRWTIDEPITPNDIEFPTAVVEHIRRHGFSVEEIHPEIEGRFNTVLSIVPQESELHKSLTLWWSKMSYLQKTDFLDILRTELCRQ